MRDNKKVQISDRKYVTQQDILKKHHRFLRQSSSSSSDSQNKEKQRSARKNNTKNVYEKYGQELAKKYYSKLYKQYALIDLSRYQTGQIGCRWRSQKQVITEKGQKYCAAVDCNKETEDIYEMNFGYMQQGIKKNALVKVSVCKQCGRKLNYKKGLKKVVKEQQQKDNRASQNKDKTK